MTDEDLFRAALEADPGNHALRRLFADWLADRGDARAAGYRWMAALGKWPFWLPSSQMWSWTDPSNSYPFHNHLPKRLYRRLKAPVDSCWRKYVKLCEAEADLCQALLPRP